VCLAGRRQTSMVLSRACWGRARTRRWGVPAVR
jgi:hypothetical protein